MSRKMDFVLQQTDRIMCFVACEGSSRRRFHRDRWQKMNLLRTELPLGIMGSVGLLVLISHPERRQEGWRGVSVDRDTKAGTSNGKGSVFLDFVD